MSVFGIFSTWETGVGISYGLNNRFDAVFNKNRGIIDEVADFLTALGVLNIIANPILLLAGVVFFGAALHLVCLLITGGGEPEIVNGVLVYRQFCKSQRHKIADTYDIRPDGKFNISFKMRGRRFRRYLMLGGYKEPISDVLQKIQESQCAEAHEGTSDIKSNERLRSCGRAGSRR